MMCARTGAGDGRALLRYTPADVDVEKDVDVDNDTGSVPICMHTYVTDICEEPRDACDTSGGAGTAVADAGARP
jgi:hypothetical protein